MCWNEHQQGLLRCVLAKVVGHFRYTVESRFLQPQRKRKLVLEIGKFERSRVKMYCLTKEGKRLSVQVIRSFEKSRVPEIGIPMY